MPTEMVKQIDLTVAEDAITALADEYMGLVVNGIDDKRGLAVVHEARMVVKRKRIAIEKQRKSLNEDALAWQRTVNAEAKRLTELLAPIESHLEEQESIVEREKARLQQVAEEQRQAIIRERLKLLFDLDAVMLAEDVARLSASEFAALLGAKTAEKKVRDEQAALAEAERRRIAEQQRVEAGRLAQEKMELDRQRKEQEAAAAAAKKIEDDRLAAERMELDRIRREQAEAQAKIDAERKRIADEEAARQRAIELEAAKAKAAEQARQQAIEEQQRAAAEAKAKAEAEELEQKRIEALRPDHEKLMAVADAVTAIAVPPVSVNAAKAASRVEEAILDCAAHVRNIASLVIAPKAGK